jgi:hypothetical protein
MPIGQGRTLNLTVLAGLLVLAVLATILGGANSIYP